MYMQLDVNTEVYPLHVGEKFTMVLAPTLNLDGTPDSGYFTQVIYLDFLFFFIRFQSFNADDTRENKFLNPEVVIVVLVL